MGIGALVSSLVGFFQNHSSLPMCIAMLCTSTIALLTYTFGNRKIVRDSSREDVMEEEVEMINTL